MFNDLYDCNLNLLIGNTIHCKPDWNWHSKTNKWSGYHLWYVLKGGATITIKNKATRVIPGDVYLFNMTDNHYCTHNSSDPLSVLTLYFIDRKKSEEIPSQKIVSDNKLLMKDLFLQTINHLKQTSDCTSVFWLQSLLNYCQICTISKTPQPLDSILSLINQQPFNTYSLEFLAAESGYSKNHLIRLFKRQTTLSPIAYCIKIKIDHVKHYLLYTNYSIAKISDITGFSDVSYLSKQFKQHTGQSPLLYRTSSSTQVI